jgi:hypothetical protein
LAELILRHETLLDREGTTLASSFIVDMNVLFERFITRITTGAAERAGWELVPQAQRWWSPVEGRDDRGMVTELLPLRRWERLKGQKPMIMPLLLSTRG